jgi:hypothetical protein
VNRRRFLGYAALPLAAGLPAAGRPKGKTYVRTIDDKAGVMARAYAVRVGRPGNPSGLNWPSFARTGSFPADYTAFATWRGKPLDGTLQYTDRSAWANLESPWYWGYTWPGETVNAQPFWPEGTGGSLTAAASGSYDTHWAAYGTNLVANGTPTALTEFAWEMNGNWFEWSATNVTNYINAWRKVITAVRSTAPNARFMWTINAHSGGVTGDPFDAYPGDSYVDVIGIDAYDHFPKSTTLTEFNTQSAAVAGLDWTLSRAQARSKKLAIPEWGVEQPSDADHGGDNPSFVGWMYDWIRLHAADLYMESYFDAAQSTIYSGGSPLNPNSGTAYISNLHN